MPATPFHAHPPSLATTNSTTTTTSASSHAPASADTNADPRYEPSEEWKANLKRRINRHYEAMAKEVKDRHFAQLRDEVVSEQGRERIMEEYKRAMQDLQLAAMAQFDAELQEERGLRAWGAGDENAVPPTLMKKMKQEQEAILQALQNKEEAADNTLQANGGAVSESPTDIRNAFAMRYNSTASSASASAAAAAPELNSSSSRPPRPPPTPPATRLPPSNDRDQDRFRRPSDAANRPISTSNPPSTPASANPDHDHPRTSPSSLRRTSATSSQRLGIPDNWVPVSSIPPASPSPAPPPSASSAHHRHQPRHSLDNNNNTDETEDDFSMPQGPHASRTRPPSDKSGGQPIPSPNDRDRHDPSPANQHGQGSLGRASSIRSVNSDRSFTFGHGASYGPGRSPPAQAVWKPAISADDDHYTHVAATVPPSTFSSSSTSASGSSASFSTSSASASASVPPSPRPPSISSSVGGGLGRRGSTTSMRSTGSGNSMRPSIEETIPEQEGSDDKEGVDGDDDGGGRDRRNDSGSDEEVEDRRARKGGKKDREKDNEKGKDKHRDKERKEKDRKEKDRNRDKDKDHHRETTKRRDSDRRGTAYSRPARDHRPAAIDLESAEDDSDPPLPASSYRDTPLRPRRSIGSATMQRALSGKTPFSDDLSMREREREERERERNYLDPYPPARGPYKGSHPDLRDVYSNRIDIPPYPTTGLSRSPYGPPLEDHYGLPPRTSKTPFPGEREREREGIPMSHKTSFSYEDGNGRQRQRTWDPEWDMPVERDRDLDFPLRGPPQRSATMRDQWDLYAAPPSHHYPGPYGARTSSANYMSNELYEDRLDISGPPPLPHTRGPPVSGGVGNGVGASEGARPMGMQRQNSYPREYDMYPTRGPPNAPRLPPPVAVPPTSATADDISQPAWRDWVTETNIAAAAGAASAIGVAGRRYSGSRHGTNGVGVGFDLGHSRSPPLTIDPYGPSAPGSGGKRRSVNGPPSFQNSPVDNIYGNPLTKKGRTRKGQDEDEDDDDDEDEDEDGQDEDGAPDEHSEEDNGEVNDDDDVEDDAQKRRSAKSTKRVKLKTTKSPSTAVAPYKKPSHPKKHAIIAPLDAKTEDDDEESAELVTTSSSNSESSSLASPPSSPPPPPPVRSAELNGKRKASVAPAEKTSSKREDVKLLSAAILPTTTTTKATKAKEKEKAKERAAEAKAKAEAEAKEQERLAKEQAERDRIEKEKEAVRQQEEALKSKEQALQEKEVELEHQKEEIQGDKVAIESKEEELLQKEEVVKRREAELKKREEDVRKKEEAAKKREQEAKRKMEEAKRLQEEVKRKDSKAEEEANKARKASDDAHQLESDLKSRQTRLKVLEEQLRQKENSLRDREAALRRREDEISEKEEEVERLVEETRQLHADAERAKADAEKREADVLKKERDALKRELEASRAREDAKRKEDDSVRREEDAKRLEEALKREEARRREEELIWKEQEARRKDEEMRLKDEETKRREEDVRRREEETRRKEEMRRKVDEARQREEEARRAEGARQEELRYRRTEPNVHPSLGDPEMQFTEEERQEQARILQQIMYQQRAEAMARSREEQRRRNDSLGADGPWSSHSPGTSPNAPRVPPSSASTASFASTDRNSSSSSSAWTSSTAWTSSSSAWSTSGKPSPSTPQPGAGGFRTSQGIPTGKPRAGSVSSNPGPFPTGSSPHTAGVPPSESDWARRQESFANEQQEKFRREQERLEAERQMRAAGRQLTRDEIARVYEQHGRLWDRLATLGDAKLTWSDFPWPTMRHPQNPDDITQTMIIAYIQSPLYPDKDKSRSTRDRIKDHIKRWHPDRFETKYLPKVLESEQEKVKQGAGNVARCLGEMLRKESEVGNFLFGQ